MERLNAWIIPLYLVLFLFRSTVCQSKNVLSFEPNSLTLQVQSSKSLQISLINASNTNSILINFTYGDESEVSNRTDLIKPLPPIKFEPNDTSTKTVKLEALNSVGHLVVGVQSDDIEIPFSNIFRVDVIHSYALNVIIQIIGWIYFAAWSISFYPQVILNLKIKDVSGLSFDFTSLNFLGHSCYCVFNVALYWSKQVQNEYFKIHPRGVNPVMLNDVLFSMHAVLLTFVVIVQIIIYRQNDKRISYPTMGILIVFGLFLSISGIVCATSKLTVLDYIYFFSYVKLAITIMKYVPQAYINYKRKSTVGWSILNVLLDFTGGAFSLLQMFFLAYNYNDWTSIFGSPTKLGLGLLSILFDVVFMIQHYVLYRVPIQANAYTPIA